LVKLTSAGIVTCWLWVAGVAPPEGGTKGGGYVELELPPFPCWG